MWFSYIVYCCLNSLQACWMMRYFSEVQFTNQSHMQLGLQHVFNCLISDKELPVKVLVQYIHVYCTLRERIKGTAIQHGLREGTCYTAQHMITVMVLAFLTQERRPVRWKLLERDVLYAIMVIEVICRGVVSILLYGYLDQTPRAIIACTALLSML